MRVIVFLAFIFLETNSFGQNGNIKKVWVGKNNSYLKFGDNQVITDGNHREIYNYFFEDSILILRPRFSYPEIAKFRVLKLTQDSLVLSGLTDYAKRISNYNKNSSFIDSSKIYDSNLIFKRIFLYSTGCFGNCPSMKMEIDSNKNFNFYGYSDVGKYQGLFKGKLSDSDYNRLIDILKKSYLDNLPAVRGHIIDAPTYDLIVEYNGKIKTFSGSHFPFFNRKLLDFLLDCYKQVELKKVHRPLLKDIFKSNRNKISAGYYKSNKEYPKCELKIKNDSTIEILSASNLYFRNTGINKYRYFEDGIISFPELDNSVKITKTEKATSEDKIEIDFYIIDKINEVPIPFSFLTIKHDKGTIHEMTDSDGFCKITLGRPLNSLKINVSAIGYRSFDFEIKIDNSSNVKLYLVEKERSNETKLKVVKANSNTIYLIKDDINLILKKEYNR